MLFSWKNSRCLNLSKEDKDIIQRILFNDNPLNLENNYTERNLYKVAYQIETRNFDKKKRSTLAKLEKIGRLKIETALIKKLDLEKGDKTNYSCFSIYSAKENKEAVKKASEEFVKLASKVHIGNSWTNKF